MASFDEAWTAISKPRNGELVSPQLKPLLSQVYRDFQTPPVSLSVLKEHLVALLQYLNGAGRTNANCWAVDLFFCLADEIGWERDWVEEELPDDFHEMFAKLGEALHDSVQSPETAENFDCLPEQLLRRAMSLEVSK